MSTLVIFISTKRDYACVPVVSGSAKGVKFLVAFLSNGAGSSDLQLIITNTNDKERAFVVVSSAVNSTMLAENVVQGQSFVELAVTNSYRMDTNGSNDKGEFMKLATSKV